jgi:hypothetical protein
VEQGTQRILGALQHLLAPRRQILARAVDVEIQHRHGGLIGAGFPPFAAFR